LCDTEGERFVLRKKFAIFQENFKDTSMKIWATAFYSEIKTSLEVIIYPLARELFALEKD
jgi:hypothetical protein